MRQGYRPLPSACARRGRESQNRFWADAQGAGDGRLRRHPRHPGTLRDSIYIAETAASDLSWLTKEDALALSVSLATLRRHQAEFMHRRTADSRNAFLAETDNFKAILGKVIAADIMKASVNDSVKFYVDAFRTWINETQTVSSNLQLIHHDTQELTPLADKIIKAAGERKATVSSMLTGSQARTRNMIIAVGCRGGAVRAGPKLVDRTQHNASPERACRRDEATGRRRHIGDNPCHQPAGRDRRHGAHGDRFPRQYGRA
jgi:hypothetical protein